jgi:hypothetical protein
LIDPGTKNQASTLSSQLRQFGLAHLAALEGKKEIEDMATAALGTARALLSVLES